MSKSATERPLGVCKYCGRNRPLIDAHIIPAAFYREVKSPGSEMLYLLPKDATVHTKRSPIGPYDPNIRCRDCEDTFQSLDDYAARFLIQERDTAFEKIVLETESVFVAERFEHAPLKLFILSVLWRASVSQIPFCRRVDLGQRLARVRAMLGAGEPGLPSEFATIFTRWDQPPEKALLPKFMASPVSRRYGHVRAVKLYLSYFVAEVFTSSVSFPPAFADFIVAPGRPLYAVALPLSGSGDVEAFRASLLSRDPPGRRTRRQDP